MSDTVTASANMSGAIVAALPAGPHTLTVPGGDPADQLHVTLLYLTGDNTELSEEHRAHIGRALVDAAPAGPVTATVSAVQCLGDDEPPAVVLMLDAPELHMMRDGMRAALADKVPVPEDTYPQFLPHLTIGYGIDEAQLQPLVGQTITLDRLAAMYGPDTHAVPLTAPADDPPKEDSMADTWHGVIGRLGTPTGDGRIIAPYAITHRELPLPLSWQRKSDEGHEQSVVVGVMTDITVDYMAGEVQAAGYWLDPAVTPEVTEARALVDARVIGPSMDAGACLYEVQYLDDDEGYTGHELVVFTAYEVAGATLVTVPAFTGVYITSGDQPDAPTAPAVEEPAAAALVAAAAPVTPPAAWFDDPQLPGPQGLTIDDDGRVFGHLATWNTCHVGLPGCVTAPPSMANYAYFTTGSVRTVEGTDVPVGHLTVGGGHADPRAGFRGAAEHYDNAGATVAVVAAGEDEHGVWVSGAIVPTATVDQVEALRRSPLSGDWRTIGGNLELIAALAVNVPGFPVPRARVALTAGGQQTSLIAAAQFTEAQPATVDEQHDQTAEAPTITLTINDAAGRERVRNQLRRELSKIKLELR